MATAPDVATPPVERWPGKRRRGAAGRALTRKVTVTIPNDVLEAALRHVEAGLAPSLSAHVSEAPARRVEADSEADPYQALLEEWARELGPPSEEAIAWAEEVMRRLRMPTEQSRSTPGDPSP